MDIQRAGSQPSAKAPLDWFTATERIDPLFQEPDPAFVQGASITPEPGASTAWHTHRRDQTLIVTAGCGKAQRQGGPAEVIGPGMRSGSPWRKALAGCHTNHRDDTHRHSGKKNSKGVDWM
jgi:quercetin dioxygenase-like cupin family protein